MKSIRKRLIDAFRFIPKKRIRILIDHENGCQCEKCIQIWVDADPNYGRIEADELCLPEGDCILFIDTNKTETSIIDV